MSNLSGTFTGADLDGPAEDVAVREFFARTAPADADLDAVAVSTLRRALPSRFSPPPAAAPGPVPAETCAFPEKTAAFPQRSDSTDRSAPDTRIFDMDEIRAIVARAGSSAPRISKIEVRDDEFVFS